VKKALLALAGLSFTSSILWAADLPVDSAISKVTVYSDRAMVTRKAQVTLPKGPSVLVFEKLPGSLNDQSLRADGSGQRPVTIKGAEAQNLFTAEEVDEKTAKVLGELEQLERDRRKIEGDRQVVADQKTFLNSIRNFSGVQISKDIMTKSSTPEEWQASADFLKNADTQNKTEDLALEQTLTDKNKEIEAKRRELMDIQRPEDRQRKRILVTVEAEETTPFTIEVSYMVPEATWSISYDAKVDTKNRTCVLMSYANARQWSGEDWKDIPLIFTTAKPSIGGQMPELDPWYIDFPTMFRMDRKADVQYASARLAKSMTVVNEFTGALSAEAPEPAPVERAKQQSAVITQDLGMVMFEIAKGSVINDNRYYKLPVQSEGFPVVLDDQTTPKAVPYVFLHSKVTNDKSHILPAGELSVFVNDAFLGKSSIKTIGMGEEFDLFLGIDEDIKVKRTEITGKRKKNLLGIRTKNEYTYRIELENYKTQKTSIAVFDQYPVSKNADIKCELVGADPKPELKPLGILKWELTLEPKEKKAIEFSYNVDYPSDKQVVGL